MGEWVEIVQNCVTSFIDDPLHVSERKLVDIKSLSLDV